MITTIGDKFTMDPPDTKTEFYAGKKDGIKCWPIRHKQGCYGDCSDCISRWEENFERIKNLPIDLFKEKI